MRENPAFKVFLALAVFSVLTAGAQAHRLNSALTTVEYNPRTRAIEVIHTLYLHDLDHALSLEAGRAVSAAENANARRATVKLIEDNFALAKPDGTPLALTLVGMEALGERLLVYYEAPDEAAPAGLTVRNKILMDRFPDQVNQVNLSRDGTVRTLMFRQGDGAKHAEFE